MIREIQGNKFTDSNGKEVYLYNLEQIDLEQKSYSQIHNLRNNLVRDLNSFKKEVTRFYHLDNQFFMLGSNDLNIRSLSTSKSVNGLSTFVVNDNFHSDAKFDHDYVKVNGLYIRFVGIRLEDDHNIDFSDLQSFGDYFIATSKINSTFSRLMLNEARKMNSTSLYKALSDIEGIEKYRENEEMLRKIITQQEQLFNTEIYFLVIENSETSLYKKSQSLIGELEAFGLSPKIETVKLNYIFKLFLPTYQEKLENPLLFHTSLLVNSLPINCHKLMSSGIGLFSRSECPIYFDQMEGDSYSICITANTGGGKTFFANKLISHGIDNLGRKTLIFDPKSDYRKQALFRNAHIIDEKINPMIFQDPVYLKNLIISMIPKSERTKKEEGRILRLIKENDLYKTECFSRVISILEAKGIYDLSLYFEEIREHITSDKQETKGLAYVEFSSFSNAVIPFLLTFCFQYVKSFENNYNLVIDEAHRVFKSDPDFLEERVREMRVLKSSLITITQSYSDLTSNHFGKIVADNSYHKFFGQQEITQSGKIDQFDVERINELCTMKGLYSEFYYKNPQTRKIFRYYATAREMELFNSEEEHTRKMLNFVKDNLKYFSAEECINKWVEFKYV